MPTKKAAQDMSEVTRVHIITELGRYEYWGDSWELELQDDGRTLKMWARGDGEKAKAERVRALGIDFTKGHEYVRRMLKTRNKI